MNKKELVESVSIERNLTKKEAELLVDTVFNTITRSVVEGDKGSRHPSGSRPSR